VPHAVLQDFAPPAPDELVEALPFHVFHGDEIDAIALVDIVDRDDVGVVQDGG
jgi:hypothetical protein